MADAACAERPDLSWFRGGAAEERAKAVCQSCLWRVECLTHAFGTVELKDVWGGMSETERRTAARSAVA